MQPRLASPRFNSNPTTSLKIPHSPTHRNRAMPNQTHCPRPCQRPLLYNSAPPPPNPQDPPHHDPIPRSSSPIPPPHPSPSPSQPSPLLPFPPSTPTLPPPPTPLPLHPPALIPSPQHPHPLHRQRQLFHLDGTARRTLRLLGRIAKTHLDAGQRRGGGGAGHAALAEGVVAAEEVGAEGGEGGVVGRGARGGVGEAG